jgi:thiol:disulfide interchange protein
MPAWCLNATNRDFGAWLLTCALIMFAGSTAASASPFGGGAGQGSSIGGPAEPRFLPVDEAFAWFVALDAEDRISIHWQIAPGYYMYREQFDFQLIDDGRALEVSLPEAAPHNDAYFGDVEIYYDRVQATIHLPEGLDRRFTLQIRYQGCAEAGLCYPPERREVEIDR